MRISPDVHSAVDSNRPVVALETSIVCQGLPWPTNLSTALACSAAVRAAGATPAVVAIVRGEAVVGATDEEVADLAHAARDGLPLQKVAARDIASCCANGFSGGTTVSATALLATIAGVRVFATGGIGGVHRFVHESWDISADIAALASVSILVVCAGVKSILDVPKTLEALESSSVPVLTLNPEKGEFPGFYTRTSGVRSPDSVSTEIEAARTASLQLSMGDRGMLLAVPIPRQHEADPAIISSALHAALDEAKAKRISGRETTPFLLGRMAELSSDHSLASNVELVKNNASVAGRIAKLICSINENAKSGVGSCQISDSNRFDVVVAGGCAVDITAAAHDPMRLGTSNAGAVSIHVGGVGHNVARAAQRTGAQVTLVSAVGNDATGSIALTELRNANMHTVVSVISGARTATYCALNNGDGDLNVAVADMKILDKRLPATTGNPRRLSALIREARIVCLDANLHVKDIDFIAETAFSCGTHLWYEPVSVAKSIKIFAQNAFRNISFMSPNADEMKAMWKHRFDNHHSTEIDLDLMARDLLTSHGGSLWIICTQGKDGVFIYKDDVPGRVHIDAAPVPGGVVASTSGAGDVFAGTMIGILARSECIDNASLQDAAKMAVIQASAVCTVRETSNKLTRAKL